MSTIASRDLRNHTRDVLSRVSQGDIVTITVHGEPVAEITPVIPSMRASLTRSEVIDMLTRHPEIDEHLIGDMAWISGDTTDDLGPVH